MLCRKTYSLLEKQIGFLAKKLFNICSKHWSMWCQKQRPSLYILIRIHTNLSVEKPKRHTEISFTYCTLSTSEALAITPKFSLKIFEKDLSIDLDPVPQPPPPISFCLETALPQNQIVQHRHSIIISTSIFKRFFLKKIF